jgi:flagellar basal-body rod modification protein FlgD
LIYSFKGGKMAISASTLTSNVANSVTAANGTTSVTRKTALTQEDFLNLFVTQMRYQNPLEPMDNYQMASQMGQMSSVESLKKVSDSLDQLVASQTSVNNFQASGLIGKKVEYQGNTLTLNQGTTSEAYYQLANPGKALIQVYNAAGNLVWQSEAGSKDGTKQKFEWNGRNQNGVSLPDGTYSFQVVALDGGGKAIPVTTGCAGTVNGVYLENGTSSLQVGQNKVSLSKITAILAQ